MGSYFPTSAGLFSRELVESEEDRVGCPRFGDEQRLADLIGRWQVQI